MKKRISLVAALAMFAAFVLAHRLVLADGRSASAVSKRAALDNIAKSVLLPGYSQLAARSADFAAAADALTSTPSATTLENDLLNAIEVGAQGRLLLAVDKRTEQHARSELVEGGPSGTSQAGVLALLVGARAVFVGGDGPGIDDYLRQLKAPAARRIEAQFQKAIDAVKAIDGPLEEGNEAVERAVRRAHDECRALEIMLQTEVASVLGVTLTFKSADGD